MLSELYYVERALSPYAELRHGDVAKLLQREIAVLIMADIGLLPQDTVAKLKSAGCKFRNEILEGPGGKQILLEDPSGNCVELFEPR